MKFNLKLFYVFILTVLCLSCNKNNDAIETTIAGQWNVKQIIGGFSQPKNYEKGSVTWEFNMSEKTVTIVNTADIFDTYIIPSFTNNQGGVYSFKIVEENNFQFLVIGNRKGRIEFSEDNLKIDYGIAFDDIAYIFIR